MTDPARGAREIAPNLWPSELDAEYINLGELGRGGMAVVFRARDRELGRDVAIKVVRPRFSADDEAVARLMREARTVARLQHPNIVALHGIRHLSDRSLALVMQLVPGRTLKSAIAEGGALPPQRVEQILADVTRALAFAHKVGVVHRDVKPENIFLDEVSGRALLSDFGVARAMDASNELTATGTTIGTPTYMPPEQIDGLEVDGRSDLYSLGMVAWEMLTGQRPWAGESLYGVIYRQKHDPLPPIDDYRQDVEPRLLYLVEGLMRKRPDRRWASAARFLALLTSREEPPGLQDWLVQRKRRRRSSTSRRAGRRDAGATATQETMRFVRGEPQQVPPPSEGPIPRGVYPEPEPTFVHADATADEAAEETPRRHGGRWVAAVLITTLVAGGVWYGWQEYTTGIGTADAGRAPVLLEDRSTIDVPVTDSAVLGAGGAEIPPAAPSGDPTTALLPPPAERATEGAVAERNASSGGVITDSAGSDRGLTPPERAVTGGERTATAPERAVSSAERPVTPPERAVAPPGAAATPPGTTGAPVVSNQRRVPDDPPGRAAPPDEASRAGGVRDSAGAAGRTVVTPPPAEPIVSAPVAPRITVVAEPRPIASGARHSCRLRADGRVECWGNNDAGQLGNGSFDGHATAIPVAGAFRFTEVAAGANHTCGVTTDGGILCWGSNGAGQLGDGTTAARAAPVRVNSREAFAAVRTGQSHTCALTRSGSVHCWGGNTYGQLGSGTREASSSPVIVELPAPATALAVGPHHSCAVTNYGAAYCWGRNNDGQLGDGTTEHRDAPTAVWIEPAVSGLAAGTGHTCAVLTSGAVWCWGRNTYGQLGRGGGEERTAVPRRVEAPVSFTAVAAGSVHTCARSADGGVWCWGRNSYGQLGDGTTTDRARPAAVPGVAPVVAVAAGAAHTCAVQRDGATWCWGYNVDGQVGRGDRDNALTPARVAVPPR